MRLLSSVIPLLCLRTLLVNGVSLLHLSQDQAEPASNEQGEGPAPLKTQPVFPEETGSTPSQTKNDEQDPEAPEAPEYYPGTNPLPVTSSSNETASGDNGTDKQSSEPEPKPILPPSVNQLDQPGPETDLAGRQKRSLDFDVGPNGEDCVLSASGSGDSFYDHVDAEGLHCQCDLCNPGYVLVQECSCNPYQPSVCRLVEEGKQMMPTRNKCRTGYDCKVCEHPWRVKTPCGKYGPDTVCECVAEGLYQPSREECKAEPRCNKGTQPVRGDAGEYTEIQCQPCPEGFFQPNNNSTDMCRPHKQCSREEGTRYSDAVCWNDAVPTTQSAHTGSQERPGLQEEVIPAPTLRDILMNTKTTTPSSVPDLEDEMNTTAKPTEGNMTTGAPDKNPEPPDEGNQGWKDRDVAFIAVGCFILGLLVLWLARCVYVSHCKGKSGSKSPPELPLYNIEENQGEPSAESGGNNYR